MQETIFTGVRAKWQPMYERLFALAQERLGAFEVQVQSSAIVWKHSSTFAEIGAKAACMTVGMASDEVHEEWNPVKTVRTSKRRVAHTFEVVDEADFEALLNRIEAAYALTKTDAPKKRPDKQEYATVDEYIALFPEAVQPVMHEVRRVIRAEAPKAQEKISWGMATYVQNGNLVHFAAAQNHLGLYPGVEAVVAFEAELNAAGIKSSKGTIQFPYAKPIPYDLIARIVRFCVQQAEQAG